jgi:hypothetical protein
LRLRYTRNLALPAIFAVLSLNAWAQTPRDGSANAGSKKSDSTSERKLTPQQKFVRDTVQMAVALPQPDPQDRLRVLSVAADVIYPLDQKLAKGLWHEGVRIESELIQVGKAPAVSVMADGKADCASALSFVENVPADSVVAAEQSLIGAVTSCRKETLTTVAAKLDAALQKKVVAPRALMAVMEAEGLKSQWSQSHFEEMFSSLPDAREKSSEAENVAAMYAHMSGEVEKDIAQKTGLKLLDWLSLQDDSPLRTLGVNIVSDAMKEAIGDAALKDALSSDVVAASVVRNAANAAPTPIQRPTVESTSVLMAMRDNGTDQSGRLQDMPASQRAREAAAHGFAAGTSGDKEQAGKYFDMAFAAVDELWEARTPEENTAAVVEEVSEAAAQVDSVNALTRAENLHDPSAQAIGMLAVARVVASAGVAR